jgi:saccharopine dehydrogenase-like NADP-dependent oxidoreductase
VQTKIESVLVLGLGKVGALVATLLHETGFDVTGADACDIMDTPVETIKFDLSKPEGMKGVMGPFDAVVSCLPCNFNVGVAAIAHDSDVHYFDLTEDVPTTRAIIKLSKTAKILTAPQCGLAPGFIGIVGASLAESFDRIRSIKLRVGALPQHPSGLLGYAFNWSAEGWKGDELSRDEFVEAYYPLQIAGRRWRAISWTTAASVCAALEMVNKGTIPAQGFLKQEQIPLAGFLKTANLTAGKFDAPPSAVDKDVGSAIPRLFVGSPHLSSSRAGVPTVQPSRLLVVTALTNESQYH